MEKAAQIAAKEKADQEIADMEKLKQTLADQIATNEKLKQTLAEKKRKADLK